VILLGPHPVAFLMLTLSAGGSLPEGYRYPADADRSGDWETFEADVPVPFRADADFNGDGRVDQAWILLRDSGRGWGLFVFLGQEDGEPVVHELDVNTGDSPAQSFGLAVVEPGEYETACGKGYGDCEPEEPEKLTLVRPAIDFFQFESANSFFWWNAKTEAFERTWMSD
jgi:hypothetical protein